MKAVEAGAGGGLERAPSAIFLTSTLSTQGKRCPERNSEMLARKSDEFETNPFELRSGEDLGSGEVASF